MPGIKLESATGQESTLFLYNLSSASSCLKISNGIDFIHVFLTYLCEVWRKLNLCVDFYRRGSVPLTFYIFHMEILYYFILMFLEEVSLFLHSDLSMRSSSLVISKLNIFLHFNLIYYLRSLRLKMCYFN